MNYNNKNKFLFSVWSKLGLGHDTCDCGIPKVLVTALV